MLEAGARGEEHLAPAILCHAVKSQYNSQAGTQPFQKFYIHSRNENFFECFSSRVVTLGFGMVLLCSMRQEIYVEAKINTFCFNCYCLIGTEICHYPLTMDGKNNERTDSCLYHNRFTRPRMPGHVTGFDEAIFMLL